MGSGMALGGEIQVLGGPLKVGNSPIYVSLVV